MALIRDGITEVPASNVSPDEEQQGNKISRKLIHWFSECIWLMFLVNTFKFTANLV